VYWIGWCEKTKQTKQMYTNRFIAYYERNTSYIYIGGDEGEDDK
jgi:hypothetical protein